LAVLTSYHVTCLGLLPAGLLAAPFALLGASVDFGWPLLFLYPSALCALVLLPILFRRPDQLWAMACFVGIPLILIHAVCAVYLLGMFLRALAESD
jgi:hypothetical protein